MSEDNHDHAGMVQGDVGETMQQIEEEERQKEEQRQKQQERAGEEGKELQADDELKQRVLARQEEKGKGELSAAIAEKEEVTDSKLLASQQRKRAKKNAKKGSISKQKEQQPNLYDLSRQLESHTKQLSTIASIVQQLPKFLKNADTQSRIIKQINSSMNQLQRQIGQIQKRIQKKKSKQK